jgi:hypothetical protein
MPHKRYSQVPASPSSSNSVHPDFVRIRQSETGSKDSLRIIDLDASVIETKSPHAANVKKRESLAYRRMESR